MSWFKNLVGFTEKNPDQVRANLIHDGENLTSKVNQKTYRCGTLETPSLAELRERTTPMNPSGASLSVSEVVANVQQLHRSPDCNGALFQVASQFNLLEMVGPGVTPEHGVGIYENDFTQGPACAIACGAATIMRNYFVEVHGQTGQSSEKQIDCLSDMESAFGAAPGQLWKMKNGYALASEEGLIHIAQHLQKCSEPEKDSIRATLRIGLQLNAEVTLGGTDNIVSQAFCSALPVAYSALDEALWEPFARLVLEASYEATLRAALLNRRDQLYLTLLGGGAFGNRMDWITSAMERSLHLMRKTQLDVKIVSYGSPTPEIQHLLA